MRFPREVWFGSHLSTNNNSKRVVVWNKEEFGELVRLNSGRRNCYTNVYDYEKFTEKTDDWGTTIGVPLQHTVILDRAFLDFDAHNDALEQAAADTLDCHTKLMEKNIKHDIIFSGRGFHIHVYGERANDIRQIQTWFRQWDYETLDDCGVQIGRHRRIINTMNMASGLYCHPIHHIELQHLGKSKGPSFTYGFQLVKWPEVQELSEAPREIAQVKKLGDLPILPCLYNSIMVENPSHHARVYLVSWWRTLLAGGSTTANIAKEEQPMVVDEIISAIKSIDGLGTRVWMDWNENETRKHVQYIVRGNYNAPNCLTKLIPEGYCVGKCWRFPE